MTNTADRTAELPGTLDDAAVAALTNWVRGQGLGSTVTGVEPLAGGTQNIVVRLRVDDRRLVLRRPPLHPRANSNRTMQREIAALRTLAGSGVPHPVFVAGCEDLDVLGVVFYLMEDVDGFNPGTDVAPAYEARPADAPPGRPQLRGRTGRAGQSALARAVRCRRCSGRVPFWRGRFRVSWHCWRATGMSATDPESLDVGRLARWLENTAHPTASRGSCTATRT